MITMSSTAPSATTIDVDQWWPRAATAVSYQSETSAVWSSGWDWQQLWGRLCGGVWIVLEQALGAYQRIGSREACSVQEALTSAPIASVAGGEARGGRAPAKKQARNGQPLASTR